MLPCQLKLSGLTLSFLEAESGMVRHDLKLDLSETPEGGFLGIKQTCLMPLPSLEWRLLKPF